MIPHSWIEVFHFSLLARGDHNPLPRAIVLRPLTMNSRASSTITTHAASRPRRNHHHIAAITISLSASGSMNFPHDRHQVPSTGQISVDHIGDRRDVNTTAARRNRAASRRK